VASANANKDIVHDIKGQAEIGGFARWGCRVMEMAAEIGGQSQVGEVGKGGWLAGSGPPAAIEITASPDIDRAVQTPD
jgi:dihydroorotase